ncbi:MAG: hypothetical protein KDD29_06700 [Flavobacteriales bacterium]|nr:hypothetical protein [Flavobacteriales bacterium]
MKKLILIISICVFSNYILGQIPLPKNNEIKLALNEDASHYIKLTFLNQVWLRYTDTNPGSTIYGNPVGNVYDIGLRRTRFQFFGKISDQVFFYTQIGQNNYTFNSKQFTGLFLHDAITEFNIYKKSLSIGTGLTGWSGLSRYASPSVGQLLSLDAPLYQQTTNGVNDQFLRKLSVYGKGKLSKLDYRIALTKPLAIQNAVTNISPISTQSEFSILPSKLQTQGYFMWQFLEQESNITPYTAGTYIGKKNIFNIGSGFIFYSFSLWRLNSSNDTLFENMEHFAIDFFIDKPINHGLENAITIYVSYHLLNFGKNYIRNIGVMNPTNGNSNQNILNGSGNNFPMIGTGKVLYVQTAYLFKKDMVPNNGKIQLYFASEIGQFDRLNSLMIMHEEGINWFIHGSHSSKISVNYQNRPVFKIMTNNEINQFERKGMLQIQYQITI